MKHLALVLMIFLALAGCRGEFKDKPPFHPNPNMDWQAKHKAQDLSLPIPAGTQAWGTQSVNPNGQDRSNALKADTAVYEGKVNGSYVSRIPVAVDISLLERGQDRYNIYCAVCHTRTGNGLNSPISKRGWVVPDITEDVTMKRSDGELYDIVANGVRTMPGYRKQVSVEDRWAIVAYVRALQKSKRGRISDVPEAQRGQLK